MTIKNKSEYINYRFRRARETFEDALIMIDNDSAPLTEANIKSFAKKFNTHPAIIIGRLQHDELIPYGLGRQFFKPVEFN